MKTVYLTLEHIDCKSSYINVGYPVTNRFGYRVNKYIDGVVYPIFEFQNNVNNYDDISTVYLKYNIFTQDKPSSQEQKEGKDNFAQYCISDYFNKLNEDEKSKKFYDTLENIIKHIVANLNKQYLNQIDKLCFEINFNILDDLKLKLPEYLLNIDDCNFINKEKDLDCCLQYSGIDKFLIDKIYDPIISSYDNKHLTVKSDNCKDILDWNLNILDKYFSVTFEGFNLFSQNLENTIKPNCKKLIFKNCKFEQEVRLSAEHEIKVEFQNCDLQDVTASLKNGSLSIKNNKSKINLAVTCKKLDIDGKDINGDITGNFEFDECKVKVLKVIAAQSVTVNGSKFSTLNIANTNKLNLKASEVKEIFELEKVGNFNVANCNIRALEVKETKNFNIKGGNIRKCNITDTQCTKMEGSKVNTLELTIKDKFEFYKCDAKTLEVTKSKDVIIKESEIVKLTINDTEHINIIGSKVTDTLELKTQTSVMKKINIKSIDKKGSNINKFEIHNIPNIDKLSVSTSKIDSLSVTNSCINELKVNNSEINQFKMLGLKHCEAEVFPQNMQRIFSFNKTQLKDLIVLSSYLEELEVYDSTITGYFVLSRNQIYKQCSLVMVGIGNIVNFTVSRLDKLFVNKIYFINKENNIITGEKYFNNITKTNINNLKKIFENFKHEYPNQSDYQWEKNNILENWRESISFIKAQLDANKNHIEANKFYQLEMLIQGKVLSSKVASICNIKDIKLFNIFKHIVCDARIDKLLHGLDKMFSNHSQSTLRAMIFYVIVVFVGGLLLGGNLLAIAFPPYFPTEITNNWYVSLIAFIFKALSTYVIWQIIKSSRQNIRRS